jgi:hypothetical protein
MKQIKIASQLLDRSASSGLISFFDSAATGIYTHAGARETAADIC